MQSRALWVKLVSCLSSKLESHTKTQVIMPMKILIAVDMEGIPGVVTWDQVTPGHFEYPRFRKIMATSVNAALKGAVEAGAKEIIVTDGHAGGYNILIEELDSRARLNSGNASPLSMVQGIQDGVNAVMFVGYHARAGTANAVLDHTWSSKRVANVWLNGNLVGEIGLNAATCGYFDAPVIMVSGDQSACAEALNLLGPVEVAVVKKATSRHSAECLPIVAAEALICEAAGRAVTRLRNNDMPGPYHVQEPVKIIVEFIASEMADRASQLPSARRLDGRQVEVEREDMLAAYHSFRALVELARE